MRLIESRLCESGFTVRGGGRVFRDSSCQLLLKLFALSKFGQNSARSSSKARSAQKERESCAFLRVGVFKAIESSFCVFVLRNRKPLAQ